MMRRFLIPLIFAGLLLAQRPPIENAWDLLAQGRRGEAVQVLRKIITANPGDADARLMLGSILAEDGNHSEAIAQLKEAVRLLPRSAQAQNALGEAFSGSGDTATASVAFEKAIELDPEFAAARVSLGLILVQADEFAAAGKHLDHALALLGNSEDAAFPHYLRAKVYTKENEVERAGAELNKAVSLRPDFAEAWSDLGEARKALLDNAGALAAFQRAVGADPENSVARYRLGSEHFYRGEVRQAVTHLEKAFRLDPQNQSTLYVLQLALRRDGQDERAGYIKEQLTKLIRERDRASQQAMVALQMNNEGAALEKAGNLREAMEKYRAALALDPAHVGIRTNFAVVLLRLGQWSQGIAELREALRRDPGNHSLQQALDDALSQAPARLDVGGKERRAQ